MNNMDAERLEFVKLWARYVRDHSDQDWSRQQNILIGSQFPSMLTKEQYLRMKSKQTS